MRLAVAYDGIENRRFTDTHTLPLDKWFIFFYLSHNDHRHHVLPDDFPMITRKSMLGTCTMFTVRVHSPFQSPEYVIHLNARIWFWKESERERTPSRNNGLQRSPNNREEWREIMRERQRDRENHCSFSLHELVFIPVKTCLAFDEVRYQLRIYTIKT